MKKILQLIRPFRETRNIVALCLAFFLSMGSLWAQTQTTETLNIADYALDNGWTNGTQYLTAEAGDVTFTATGTNNTGKYYSNDNSWRFYANENATLTISVPDGYTLVSVTPTFTVKDNGTLLYDNSNVTSGSSVSVSGESAVFTISQSDGNKGKIFFTEIEVSYVSPGSTTPYISADNVELTYDATSGQIEYTINNPANGGVLTASTNAEWISDVTVSATAAIVTFTTTANTDAAQRTGTVTLTYTYGNNPTVTKNVTVTQAGNPNVVDNISDIIGTGAYTVQGTIVAKSQRGFIVGDGTGYVYYFNQNYAQNEYNVGDIVKLAGNVVVYGGVYEFNNSTTITSAETSNYVEEEPVILTGEDMDARVASTTPAALSTYVQYQGTLTISNNYYNITSIDGATTAKGSISYPINTDFASLNGSVVVVKGYYVGVSSSQYYNTMIGSITEVIGDEPSISASNVELDYDATSGEIEFTINNPTNDGVLTASADAEWISDVTVSTATNIVTFTTTENMTAASRTATITLTYSYGNDEPATKDVTVTQAGNPDAVNNISDITAAGTYTVQGTIVAKSQRGFIVGDGTGYAYYYNQNYADSAYNIGDIVNLAGPVVVYGGVYEFNSNATVTFAQVSNYVEEEPMVLTGADMDARVASTTPAALSTYVQYQGTLSVSGTHYNITNIDGASTAIGSISFPLNTDFTSLNGHTVIVEGYYVGISSSIYYNTMLGNITEVASTDTTISVATLPFVFNGGKNDIDTIDGLTQEGLGSYNGGDNATTPLKFDNTGDWLLLHFNEQPGILTFDITGNSFSGGTFTVQASVDGETYSDLASYTELGTTTTKEINNIGEDVRYIKWIYTNKASGNVGLGSITLDEPSTAPTILLDEEEIAVGYEGGEGNITVTYLNMGDAPTATVEFYAEDGESFAEYDWITAEIDAENNIHYTVDANEGVARTAYMKVYGITTDFGDEAYSHLITVAQAAAPQQYTLTISEIENLEIFTFVDDLDELALEGAGTITVTEGAAVSLSVSADEGYVLSSLMVDGQSVLSQLDETGLYTFEMPDHNVIVTASAIENVPGEWVLTSIEDLTENDIFVIVETLDGVSHAMANDNGAQNPPAADSVTVVGNTLSGVVPVNIQWNISVSDSGFVFYPNGDAESWLYCNNTNNGVRVGTGANKFFIMDTTGYLINTGTGRYIGVYLNNPDWRCYTSINNNIQDQTFAFYKKVTTTNACNIALNEGTTWVSFNVETTLDNLKAALVEAVPGTQIQITGQNSSTTYNNGRWRGNLTWNLGYMYKIKVTSACEITLEGDPIDPADYPITINSGNNWIAFPLNENMTPADAFAGFAVQGDQITSQTGASVYNRNRWQGNIPALQPGKGYVYKTGTPRTLVYPSSAR